MYEHETHVDHFRFIQSGSSIVINYMRYLCLINVEAAGAPWSNTLSWWSLFFEMYLATITSVAYKCLAWVMQCFYWGWGCDKLCQSVPLDSAPLVTHSMAVLLTAPDEAQHGARRMTWLHSAIHSFVYHVSFSASTSSGSHECSSWTSWCKLHIRLPASRSPGRLQEAGGGGPCGVRDPRGILLLSFGARIMIN